MRSGPAIPLIPINHTIVPIGPSPEGPPLTPPSAPPPLNLPLPDLVNGPREQYLKYAIPLYQASLVGNWEAASVILKEKPELVRSAITESYETMLHVAASAKSTASVERFVDNLVNLMDKKDMELQNKDYQTAFVLAVIEGNVKTSKIMVKKNYFVMELPGNDNVMPLYMAAAYAQPDMLRYLYGFRKMTGDYWTHENRSWVLQKCVEADIFDVALEILNDYPELFGKRRLLMDVLSALAQKRRALIPIKQHIIWRIIKSVFHLEVGPAEKQSQAFRILEIVWQKVATMPKGEIDEIICGPPIKQGNVTQYPSRALFLAVKSGNRRFIIELIRSYPEVVLKLNDKGRTIFHEAVKCRNIPIYNLLYEIGSLKDQITRIKDVEGNNMLHLVARCSNLKRWSGDALKLQWELLWYQEVEQMIPADYRQERNIDGYTPRELFSRSHAELVTKAEEWMKNTASQCMVVATLIATMVFAAAFALPGGYNQDTGIPFFSHEPSLIVFVISDAVSLLTSSTSVLMFLSIFTSRFAETDFLEILPLMLIMSIATLFLSIVTMMIAFSASFFVLYKKNLQWMPILVTCMAGTPVFAYHRLQLPLLEDFYSSLIATDLFNPERRMLYK